MRARSSFTHVGLEIEHALQVRVSSSQVVHREEHPAAFTHFAEHAPAEVVVGEGRRFGDLHEHVMVVKKERIVRANEPARAELVRVQVDEQR